jgi:hypothetical protein
MGGIFALRPQYEGLECTTEGLNLEPQFLLTPDLLSEVPCGVQPGCGPRWNAGHFR